MSAHRVADDDAGTRAAVWVALGELYLDTQMTPHTQEHIARLLAASPYSIEELHCILVDEVHPALHANLMQAAGQWAGFENDWLVARVRETCARPLWRRRLSRLTLDLVRDDWRVVREHLLEQRADKARDRTLRQA